MKLFLNFKARRKQALIIQVTNDLNFSSSRRNPASVAIYPEIILKPKLFIAGNCKRQFSHADSNDSSVFAIRLKKNWPVEVIQ